MLIPAKINDRWSAGEAWLRAKVAQDEAILPPAYERPLKVIPPAPFALRTATALYAFSQEVQKEAFDFLFSI